MIAARFNPEGGLCPVHYDALIDELEKKLIWLKSRVAALEDVAENIVVPSNSKKPKAIGPNAMVDMIEKDYRRPLFLNLYDDKRNFVYSTKSPAMLNAPFEPEKLVGLNLKDIYADSFSYQKALGRFRRAHHGDNHSSVSLFRRDLLDYKVHMRYFKHPQEKNLVVHIVKSLSIDMYHCHLSQPVDRDDFSSASKFYSVPYHLISDQPKVRQIA